MPNAPDSSPEATRATLGSVPPTPEMPAAVAKATIPETGGPAGPDPTRFGDWERAGRCIDF
jgi:hypothetical protein